MQPVSWSVVNKQWGHWSHQPHHHGHQHWWQSTICQEAIHSAAQALQLGASKRLKVWKEQVSSPEVFPHGPGLSSWSWRSWHQVNCWGEECVSISMLSMLYNLKWWRQIVRQKEIWHFTPLLNINQLYAQLRGANIHYTWFEEWILSYQIR